MDEAIKATNSKILIESIKNFFPHLEVLRKKYMPNFIAPNETFKLPVVNSDEQILFSKDFVKRNLDLNKYNDLILMNVTEDNMQGTINLGDVALIIKFQNKRIKDVVFKNGIYAINLNGNICIRRLQFLNLKQRTLVHIISDNKKYRDDPVDFLELMPLIYGMALNCHLHCRTPSGTYRFMTVVLTMNSLVHWPLVGGWRIIVLTGIAIRQKHH